jgi:hypothetical protein
VGLSIKNRAIKIKQFRAELKEEFTTARIYFMHTPVGTKIFGPSYICDKNFHFSRTFSSPPCLSLLTSKQNHTHKRFAPKRGEVRIVIRIRSVNN